MTLEIRPITDEEVERAEFITMYSFNSPERRDMAAAVERSRRIFPNDWSLASFEDGEMTAFIRVIPFAMRVNGRGLSFGAVGPVVPAPEHRRRGHAGAPALRCVARASAVSEKWSSARPSAAAASGPPSSNAWRSTPASPRSEGSTASAASRG